MSSTLPRRSYRLMLKQAERKICDLLDKNSIEREWVFSNRLFQARAYHEWFRAQSDRRYGCRCEECGNDDLDATRDDLPENNYTNEEVEPVIIKLITLCQETPYVELQIIYALAIMRMIFGPARILLKNRTFRKVTEKKCQTFKDVLTKLNMTTHEIGSHLMEACTEVEALIDNFEDDCGYNIFHGY